MQSWSPEADRRRLDCIHLGAAELRAGGRVRLQLHHRSDVFDLVLNGRTATIESIEEDQEGRQYLAVTIDDDPGRDLGLLKQPGHRFFVFPSEVLPLEAAAGGPP